MAALASAARPLYPSLFLVAGSRPYQDIKRRFSYMSEFPNMYSAVVVGGLGGGRFDVAKLA
jgi:hypothetical protein